MIKYYIKSYTKKKQSFLAMVNSIDHTYGQPKEPYTIVLERRIFGRFKKEITKEVYLPKGFNHQKELEAGREFIIPK